MRKTVEGQRYRFIKKVEGAVHAALNEADAGTARLMDHQASTRQDVKIAIVEN